LDLDRLDIEILYLLFIEDKKSPIQAFRITDIMEKTKVKSAYNTFVRRIQEKLVANNLIAVGYKIRNAKTYYLTKEGLSYLEKNVLKIENEERLFEYYDGED
jgi:predicted transcriptional regulator